MNLFPYRFNVAFLLFLILFFVGAMIYASAPDFIKRVNYKNYVQNLSGDTITVKFSSSNLTSEKYEAACAELRGAGFIDVTSVPKNDLDIWEVFDSGNVSEVTIDGFSHFEPGDSFSKTAVVIVRYHSLK